jgi:hypothetical protein
MSTGERHRPGRGRALYLLGACLGALALAGCQGEGPPAAGPPPDPPSGAIRPGEPIPYAVLAEHLSFNTKSRMGLMALSGRVVVVRGPVWKVEREGLRATLRLGTERGSVVRAHLADGSEADRIREGQEVHVTGTFAFRGTEVLLEDATLRKGRATPARSPVAGHRPAHEGTGRGQPLRLPARRIG